MHHVVSALIRPPPTEPSPRFEGLQGMPKATSQLVVASYTCSFLLLGRQFRVINVDLQPHSIRNVDWVHDVLSCHPVPGPKPKISAVPASEGTERVKVVKIHEDSK